MEHPLYGVEYHNIGEISEATSQDYWDNINPHFADLQRSILSAFFKTNR